MFNQSFSLSKRIKKNPQLFWAVCVVFVIIAGFFIVMQLFNTIVRDAQSQLVDIQIASTQDLLVEFVELKEESKEKVDSAIVDLMAKDSTIVDLTFYIKENGVFTLFASSNTNTKTQTLTQLPAPAQLALADTKNSYTIKLQNQDAHLYQTFRSLIKDGEVVGLIETTQTASQPIILIEENIKKVLIATGLVALLILFVFFKYSKIINYIILYEELKQVDKLKDDFISLASYHLKTPLTAIRGYSEYLIEAQDVPEEYKEYSRRIDVSSKELVTFVDKMFDALQIKEGRMQFEMQKILVPDFIKNTMADFETLAKEKGLKFTYQQEGLKFPYIQADQDKLRQVLARILENSIKYTKEGEVTIRLSNNANKIEIQIHDTGIGMSEEEKKFLFEKFYRIPNDKAKKIKGTGLGLWIAKQLIEKMNGELSIKSVMGTGTDVIIKFETVV